MRRSVAAPPPAARGLAPATPLRAPPPGWRSCQLRGLEGIEGAVRNERGGHEQLTPGELRLWIGRAEGRDGSLLNLGHVTKAIRTRCAVSTERGDLLLVLSGRGPGEFCGRPVRPGSMVYLPPGTDFEGAGLDEYSWATVSLTPEDLTRRIRRIAGTDLWRPSDGIEVRHMPAAALARFLLAHRAVRAEPDLPGGDPGALAERWADDAVRTFLGAPESKAAPLARLREQTYRDAQAWLRAHAAQTVYSADLCQAVGASERTVQYAFRERLGLTPFGFLTLVRLNAARREFMAARHEPDVQVRSVAGRWGFATPGRFATLYRRLFGETPTMTLGRRRRG